MATSEENTGSPKTLSEANRNKLNWLENHFEEKIEELEAENRELRRELAELKGDGGGF